VENQIENKIKVLMTNNGGDFCVNEFKELCKKCDIEEKNNIGYTPQENRVA
jgi:hypothetical protein